jgi:hypothetical protein
VIVAAKRSTRAKNQCSKLQIISAVRKDGIAGRVAEFGAISALAALKAATLIPILTVSVSASAAGRASMMTIPNWQDFSNLETTTARSRRTSVHMAW